MHLLPYVSISGGIKLGSEWYFESFSKTVQDQFSQFRLAVDYISFRFEFNKNVFERWGFRRNPYCVRIW